MRLTAILPPLTLITLLLRAQVPAPKHGSVEGSVVNSATGEPIKKASVWLERPPGPDAQVQPPPTALSDASGRFHFDNVELGLYTVGAQHDAYMDPQGRYATPAPFQVAEEQDVSGIVVKLVPLGVLSGHVQDEDGDPIPRASVAVLRYFYESARTRLEANAQVQTNDLGEFEVLNLAPGRYYLQVAGPHLQDLPVHTHWTRPEEAFPITFYPDARQISEATPIDVPPGAHVGNLDFHLRKAPAYHIRGKVAGQTGGQPETIDQFMVDTPGTRFAAIYQAGLQADGSFDIPGVPSGWYDVSYTHARFGKGDTLSRPIHSHCRRRRKRAGLRHRSRNRSFWNHLSRRPAARQTEYLRRTRPVQEHLWRGRHVRCRWQLSYRIRTYGRLPSRSAVSAGRILREVHPIRRPRSQGWRYRSFERRRWAIEHLAGI